MPAERLSALDAAFVKLDELGAPYVVAALLVFERAPLAGAGGGLDAARLGGYVAASLDRLPRYRQRIARVPLLGHPVWVDDASFDLAQHLRFVALEPPGSRSQLDAFAGRVLARELDLSRPPWELWFIDGVEEDRVAVLARVHHALVDGIAGVRLLLELLRGVPDDRVPARLPSSASVPSRAALLRDELAARVAGLRSLRRRMPGEARRLLPALGRLIARGLTRASDAGINPRRVGRRRAIVRLDVPLEGLRRAARAAGAKLNDAVLASVAGALRQFLLGRGVDVARLGDFRAMVPASTHDRDATSTSGNRVALMLARLPLDEPDPLARLLRVRAVTRELKTRGDEVAAGELLVRVADVTVPSLLPAILALSLRQRGFNVVVTNVPGPPFPLYLLGARLVSFHPVVNLWPRQSFGVALLSYLGTLHVTISAEPALVPDLARLSRELEASFAELCGATLTSDAARGAGRAAAAAAPSRSGARRAR